MAYCIPKRESIKETLFPLHFSSLCRRALNDSYHSIKQEDVKWNKNCKDKPPKLGHLFFIASFNLNPTNSVKMSISVVLKIKEVPFHERYVGPPSSLSYKKISTFGYMKYRIRKYLQNWKGAFFLGGRMEILLEAVIQAIPSYSMSCFRLSKGIIEQRIRLMARFW